ncbi:MAG: thioredoxin-disulfide reductase [Campylobacteraceae bacterium]|nr:thioredoxin-disulfide reductase [Campylobacteraceae bacterium]
MLDLAIIGGGPAGLTAGMYATRGGLKNVVMYEKGMPGGQITLSSEIENYPGQVEVVTGIDMMSKWPEQCMKFGLKHEMAEVLHVRKEDGIFKLDVNGEVVEAKSVIVCTGSNPRRANVDGEDEFFGKGVSTCATCDGFFYKGKEVVVLGGGDTALEEAHYLAKICSKVYLVHRRDTFRASPVMIEKVKNTENIELVLNSTVKKIYGNAMGVEGVITTDKEGNERDIKVPGVFVFVGMIANNETLKQEDGSFLCELNEQGQAKVDLNMKTSTPGLFVAGDLRMDAARQVVCAAGDGATAALSAMSYIDSLE